MLPDCPNYGGVSEDIFFILPLYKIRGRKEKEPRRNSRRDAGTGDPGVKNANMSEGLGFDQLLNQIYSERTPKGRGLEGAVTNAAY